MHLEAMSNKDKEGQVVPAATNALTGTSMSEDFAQSTRLALRTQQEILQMPLADTDPNFRAKLAAKASVASHQINAQLKADENQLKASRNNEENFYDELKAALEDYYTKRAAKVLLQHKASPGDDTDAK
jgi:hypothetical protein